MSGYKLAALYGLIPNRLGFCGPKQEKLKDFIANKITAAKIIPVLKQFEAAYPYYQLIAKKNNAKPFDKKVVEAYWLGNEYLDKVSLDDLRQLIIKKFSAPGLLSKKAAGKKAATIPAKSKPHHSFHVMILGSITGRVDFANNTKLQDTCRVAWGQVIKLKNKKITVEYEPLIKDKNIKFGAPVKKDIFWDKQMISKIKIGDWVTIHWNHAIQILTKSECEKLKKYTQNTLNSLYGEK